MKFIFLILFLLPIIAISGNTESWYQDKYCLETKEYILPDKARVDCLTDEFAIEYDHSYKWAECIGQAQYYARQTGKLAGCVLINSKPQHLNRLLNGFDGAVWTADDEEINRVR